MTEQQEKREATVPVEVGPNSYAEAKRKAWETIEDVFLRDNPSASVNPRSLDVETSPTKIEGTTATYFYTFVVTFAS